MTNFVFECASATPRATGRARRRRERGFSLIVVLLLMVALAFIGVSAMRNVTLQEKMAGNMYTRAVASQESEAGLRYAKQQADALMTSTTPDLITSVSSSALPGNRTGLVNNATQAFWAKAANWSAVQAITGLDSARPVTVAVALEQMSGSNPQCGRPGGANPTLGSGAQAAGACPVTLFRASSRASDSATGATAIFQSWSMYPAD